MPSSPELTQYEFLVSLVGANGLKMEDQDVLAAYFQESGRYTVFKDVDHTMVAGFKTDLVTQILRTE